MEEIYNVFWEGLEHRVIIDRAKVDPTQGPDDQNGFWGVNNLPFPVIAALFRSTQLPGLKYEKE